MVRLEGRAANRDGIGAVVRIGEQHNIMTTAVGYASASHAGVHFGLGPAAAADRVEIRWPGGKVQVMEKVKSNQIVIVSE